MTRRKSHPWVQPMFSYGDMLFCPLQTEMLVLRAERRALCDCMPANSLRWALHEYIWGHFHLSSHPVTLKTTLFWNLYSCTSIFISTYLQNRHFIFFSLISLLSEAFMEIMHHKGSGIFWDDFYTTDVLHCETHACEISLIVSIVVGFGTVFICFLWSIICLLYFLVFDCIMYSRMHW